MTRDKLSRNGHSSQKSAWLIAFIRWINFLSKAERKLNRNCSLNLRLLILHNSLNLHGIILHNISFLNLQIFTHMSIIKNKIISDQIKQDWKSLFHLRFSLSWGTILSSVKTAPIKQTIWSVSVINDIFLYHFRVESQIKQLTNINESGEINEVKLWKVEMELTGKSKKTYRDRSEPNVYLSRSYYIISFSRFYFLFVYLY